MVRLILLLLFVFPMKTLSGLDALRLLLFHRGGPAARPHGRQRPVPPISPPVRSRPLSPLPAPPRH